MSNVQLSFSQVLVSIQSLVLVAEPFYNEPGYAGGNHPTQSKNYNKNVFTNNLKHAILEQLTAPPQGFEEVVRTHFYYRKESLIKARSHHKVNAKLMVINYRNSMSM